MFRGQNDFDTNEGNRLLRMKKKSTEIMKNHLLCVIDLLAGAALRPPLGSWILYPPPILCNVKYKPALSLRTDLKQYF